MVRIKCKGRFNWLLVRELSRQKKQWRNHQVKYIYVIFSTQQKA